MIAEAIESRMVTSSATKPCRCLPELVNVMCGTNDTKSKVFHEHWHSTGKPHGRSHHWIYAASGRLHGSPTEYMDQERGNDSGSNRVKNGHIKRHKALPLFAPLVGERFVWHNRYKAKSISWALAWYGKASWEVTSLDLRSFRSPSWKSN